MSKSRKQKAEYLAKAFGKTRKSGGKATGLPVKRKAIHTAEMVGASPRKGARDKPVDLADESLPKKRRRLDAGDELETRTYLRSPRFVEELQRRMLEAKERRRMSFAEIGERMGVPGDKNPHNTARKLVHESPSPELVLVLRYCAALGEPATEIIPLALDPMK